MEDEEIARRKPVWIALSEFYLDTELDENDIQRIAKILKYSGYSIEELKLINYVEVAPLVSSNLLNVTGEWAGFDEDWLVSEIINLKSKRKSKSIFNRIIIFILIPGPENIGNSYFQK